MSTKACCHLRIQTRLTQKTLKMSTNPTKNVLEKVVGIRLKTRRITSIENVSQSWSSRRSFHSGISESWPGYSNHLKTGHPKTGYIRKPDILSSGFQMALVFENRTKLSGFRMVMFHRCILWYISDICDALPFENRTKMSGFRTFLSGFRTKMSGFQMPFKNRTIWQPDTF